ncbi:hypothetical protein NXH76_29140 [Blautia schinkii]|nr:hypothetical protein [Blautia schinkii]
MKKKIAIVISAFFIGSGIFTSVSMQVNASTNNQYIDMKVSNVSIQPRAEIIGWRYKVVNNVLYKRQYNYTRQQWIGEWERCG